MQAIRVKNNGSVVAWGGAYWQYFEDFDKVTTFEDTPLKLKKKLFKEIGSNTGPVLQEVSLQKTLLPGDKIVVRIELKVDRDMEYVHMKDNRASGFEPINVLSSYKWRGGLGYYESTGDVYYRFFLRSSSKKELIFLNTQ